ncbi:hypothetical protein [Tuwongella immobilis]|uniref:Uncharacterized protein n=1 Tax=Tuwongella immobilis TaxID=692036 RepID=A0A6C2YLF6_9BACT|nr:hypothetical protein [Tuwongella immobilis]VIP01953.1 unnamed protein product [Tuwongella immobilis]VTR99946.1 unnamed protein product [Tuwongella immobilis]
MDPQTQAYVIAGVWTFAALTMAWTWIPALCAALGMTRHRLIAPRGTTSPESLQPKPNDLGYAAWFAQLQALDFEPIGSGEVRIDFLGPRWQIRSGLRFFRHRSQPILAMVQQLPAPFSVWRVVHLATVLVDGTLVLTGNSNEDRFQESEYFWHQTLKSEELTEILAAHATLLGEAANAGNKADSDRSLEAVLVAMDRGLTPLVQRAAAKAGRMHLFLNAMVHLAVSTPIIGIFSEKHWGLALSNAVMAVLLLMSDWMRRKAAAAQLQEIVRFREATRRNEPSDGTPIERNPMTE